jgi:predicted metal-dependent hydrolase
MEWIADHALRTRERLMSAQSNLAATAALEHFTATLAELVLTSEPLRADLGHKTGRDLFVWHALEESEHKAVAFDVYKAIGGSESTRVITMKVVRSGLILAMAVHILTSLAADRDTYRRGVLRQSWHRFRASPLMRREVWEQLKDYDRPDFHPNDRDTDDLVASWREQLFGSEGEMVDHLVGANTPLSA